MQNPIRPGVSILIACLSCLVLLPDSSRAITAPQFPLAQSLTPEQGEALETLALADALLRDAILEAAQHPQKIEQIAGIAEQSSASFRARMDEVPRSKQKDIWELVRHPELIDAIVLGGRPSQGSIDPIVEPYPERVREIARRCAQRDFNLLSDIAHLREDAEHKTAGVLASLPLESQASFEMLIERPDLMTTLAVQRDLTRELGAAYRASPGQARESLDRVHDELVEEKERELAEWREMIEEDPEAKEELIESAELFAEEQGYESPQAATAEPTISEVHHYHHPYPYWFGPPYWTLGVHWYPHRSHWGFSFGFNGGVWIHGLPSPAFSYWHFGHSRHSYRSHASHRGHGYRPHSRHPRHGRYARLHNRWSEIRRGDRRGPEPRHERRRASRRHSKRRAPEIENRFRRGDGVRIVRPERKPGKRRIEPTSRHRGNRENTAGIDSRRRTGKRKPEKIARRSGRERVEEPSTRRTPERKQRSLKSPNGKRRKQATRDSSKRVGERSAEEKTSKDGWKGASGSGKQNRMKSGERRSVGNGKKSRIVKSRKRGGHKGGGHGQKRGGGRMSRR